MKIKSVFAVIIFFLLSANWLPATQDRMMRDAERIIEKCKAQKVIAVIVDERTKMRIVPLKKPSERNEADLRALRCVGRQSTGGVDFRPVAELLLTMNDNE